LEPSWDPSYASRKLGRKARETTGTCNSQRGAPLLFYMSLASLASQLALPLGSLELPQKSLKLQGKVKPNSKKSRRKAR